MDEHAEPCELQHGRVAMVSISTMLKSRMWPSRNSKRLILVLMTHEQLANHLGNFII